jgi:hypothetical protein
MAQVMKAKISELCVPFGTSPCRFDIGRAGAIHRGKDEVRIQAADFGMVAYRLQGRTDQGERTQVTIFGVA